LRRRVAHRPDWLQLRSDAENRVEPAGSNCVNGGTKVSFGYDNDVNGILESTEVSTSTYICNGEDGDDVNLYYDNNAVYHKKGWGQVMPIKVDKYDNVDEVLDVCKAVLDKIKLIEKSERFIITGGVPMGVAGTTNYLSIQTL